MAILKVAQMGHPVLRRVADAIDPEIIATPAFQRICEDMLATMDEYDGAGLAAPQVHLSIRLVVLTLDDEPEVWVNPVLTPLTEQEASMYEGCLSISGMRGRVSRPARLHVSFTDRAGNARAYVLQGFPAVVSQHECDHLDGILYVDRADPRTLAFMEEYRKFGRPDRYFEDEAEAPSTLGDLGWDDAVIEVPPELDPHAALEVARPHLDAATEEE